jgi:hypothetical protein
VSFIVRQIKKECSFMSTPPTPTTASGTRPEDRTFAENLERRLRITSGVRFESNARFGRKHHVSTLAISVLSLCVIAAELLSLLIKTKTPIMELLFPIATIIAPIFIIILASHETAKQYLVHAERMHRSAQHIQELHSKLEFLRQTSKLTDDELDKIRHEYETVLHDFSSDHNNIDYFFFQALHPRMFTERDNSWLRRINLQIRGRTPYYFDLWAIPVLFILLPLALLGVAVWSLIRVP